MVVSFTKPQIWTTDKILDKLVNPLKVSLIDTDGLQPCRIIDEAYRSTLDKGDVSRTGWQD